MRSFAVISSLVFPMRLGVRYFFLVKGHNRVTSLEERFHKRPNLKVSAHKMLDSYLAASALYRAWEWVPTAGLRKLKPGTAVSIGTRHASQRRGHRHSSLR